MPNKNGPVQKVVNQVLDAAKEICNELGGGWNELIYQKGMEVALRQRSLTYETQRILPITYDGHVIGESIPGLVVWAKLDNGHRMAIVFDLKWEAGVKEDHKSQVAKYIQELKKQVKSDEEVFPTGFVINFVKDASSKKLEETEIKHIGGVEVVEVTI